MIEGISICCSPDLKIALGQMVRMFKSIRSREVFRGKPELKKRCGAESVGHMAKYEESEGRGNDGLSNNICNMQEPGKPQEELRQLTLF
jgi:hypothetical protein